MMVPPGILVVVEVTVDMFVVTVVGRLGAAVGTAFAAAEGVVPVGADIGRVGFGQGIGVDNMGCLLKLVCDNRNIEVNCHSFLHNNMDISYNFLPGSIG
jgi:hypothetical protein